MNNLGYVMVSAAAHDLAAIFHKRRLMPMFQLFLDSFTAVIWYANSRYFIKIQHRHRLTFNSILMFF